MYEWPRLIQGMVDEIDRSILAREEETLTLQRLSRDMGYSAYHATRKFREIAGMPLRDYLCPAATAPRCAGCELDTATPGRLTYFYFEPGQYFKYIRPIRRK